KRRPEEGLMLHTDRGVEYRGSEYQKELHKQGIDLAPIKRTPKSN
ncbi:hypothetical protein SAMN05421686_1111, partial [Thalassolituus maritimus]